MDAETAHRFSLSVFHWVLKIPLFKQIVKSWLQVNDVRSEITIAGIRFPNRIGLAAGMDKNAEYLSDFETMGFGFVEIGTVTPKPQPGNEKPRLFRLVKDHGIINRMGFNNDGAEVISGRLAKRKTAIIVGGNIGKNKMTENEKAVTDYESSFLQLAPLVDYIAVNVSSPNTPGLRALQDKEPLLKILTGIQEINQAKGFNKPVFLKIAPDLTDSQLDEVIAVVQQSRLSGIIATNTTLDRAGISINEKQSKEIGPGGLSGKPLANRSTQVISYLFKKSNGAIPIIGVGGIHSPQDAKEKLEAGASLLQLYTGLIYEGPMLVKRINKFLLKEKR